MPSPLRMSMMEIELDLERELDRLPPELRADIEKRVFEIETPRDAARLARTSRAHAARQRDMQARRLARVASHIEGLCLRYLRYLRELPKCRVATPAPNGHTMRVRVAFGDTRTFFRFCRALDADPARAAALVCACKAEDAEVSCSPPECVSSRTWRNR